MNDVLAPRLVFQILAIALLTLLLLWQVVLLRRGSLGRRGWVLRSSILVAAGGAIAYPGITQRAAHLIGIGRGADVVLYAFVLFFIGTSFYFYSRCVHLQRQITGLVRHLALEGARRGEAPAQSPEAD